MTHLVKEMHDVVNQAISIWCDNWQGGQSVDVEQVDCAACLAAAVEFGAECKSRLDVIKERTLA